MFPLTEPPVLAPTLPLNAFLILLYLGANSCLNLIDMRFPKPGCATGLVIGLLTVLPTELASPFLALVNKDLNIMLKL